MRELIWASISFVMQMMVFFCMGSLVMWKMKLKKSLSLTFVLGYLFYFAVFEILMVPMTLLWVPLSKATLIWVGIVFVLSVFGGFLAWKGKIWQIQRKKIWKEHSWFFVAAVAVIVLQCLLIVLYQDTTLDATYYVGLTSTSVYTDTLQRYHPYTGTLLSKFQARYVFSVYPMHNAVWCKLFGVHPLVQAKVVMAAVNVLATNGVIYNIGKKLLKEQKKQADLMLCLVAFLQMFCATIYTSGTFFYTRLYEGKAILANISIAMVLYCGIYFRQNTEDKQVWVLFFISSLSAVAFSGSAIIMPAVIGAAVVPVILLKKQFKKLFYYGLSILPSVLYAAVYISEKMGWLVFRAS